jgi:hypothetical protein
MFWLKSTEFSQAERIIAQNKRNFTNCTKFQADNTIGMVTLVASTQ